MSRGADPDVIRVDRWLWAARFFKTRSLAAEACHGGKVDVNEQTAKPARAIRAGDLLRVTLTGGKRVVKVAAITDRRRSGAGARALYEDLTPPAPLRVPGAGRVFRPVGAGRPTKRDRRRLERLRARPGTTEDGAGGSRPARPRPRS